MKWGITPAQSEKWGYESKKNRTKMETTQFLIELQPKIFING